MIYQNFISKILLATYKMLFNIKVTDIKNYKKLFTKIFIEKNH